MRRPKHSVKKGKTSVLDAGEMRDLLASIDTGSLLGLRDRALIALMGYTFARVGAAVGMRVEDFYIQNRRGWVRLHEKGGKVTELPCHHNLDQFLEERITAAGLAGELEAPLFPTFRLFFPNAAVVAPSGALLEKSEINYLLSSDPSRWRTHVPNYARVAYKDLYPGIDAVFYGNGQQLKQDFIVPAGTDYHQIRTRLSPNAHAALATDGNLTLSIADGSFRILPDGDISFSIKTMTRSAPW